MSLPRKLPRQHTAWARARLPLRHHAPLWTACRKYLMRWRGWSGDYRCVAAAVWGAVLLVWMLRHYRFGKGGHGHHQQCSHFPTPFSHLVQVNLEAQVAQTRRFMVISSNLFSAVQMVTWTLKVSLSLRHEGEPTPHTYPCSHRPTWTLKVSLSLRHVSATLYPHRCQWAHILISTHSPHLSVFTLSHAISTPDLSACASKDITWATDILASRPFRTCVYV